MSDFPYWFLLVLTAGSLVPVASTVMRRSQSCEEQLQAVSVDPAICERIRSAASCVRRAVLDIDAKISKSAKEAIEEATNILRSSTHHLKMKLPQYLKGKRRSLQKREVPDDLSNFHALVKKAASSAVLTVKEGSKEVRDALVNIIIALHSSHDDINEATRDILGKMMAKRSTDEAVGQAMVNASIELKAAMTKAVLTALSGFNDMVNNMEIKTKTLLQDRVRVGFFGDRKAQIAELADQAARGIVDFYHSLAVKSVNDAIMKVNDLFIALYVIEKINPNADVRPIVRRLAESVSQTVKDTMQPEEPNPEDAVARAMRKAAEQMVLDYNDLVRLVNNA